MNEHIDFAKELAHEAGEIMMKYFQAENLGLELKQDSSPVTLADTEVNALVIARVKQRFPDHGVLGEEDSFNLKSNKLWIVDPVDGTSTFARGLAGWVFSMAYVEDGKPQVAVVYDPILERLFWAKDDLGAFAHSLALTGAGRIDAVATSCKNPWDLAAGGFIAQQAGATVTDIFGKQIVRWDQDTPGMLAAPPKIHAMLLELILPLIKDAELQ
jgi:fructose-1,6-bisphosphatase/inositol monophosphatase family enzyme